MASNLAEGLVARGQDVTLFATADSITIARLSGCCPTGYAEDDSVDAKVNECLHISMLMERADEFDIIHNDLPLTFSRLIQTPMITTIHGFSSPLIVPVFEKYNADVHYVSISNASRHPRLQYTATVYNGIDTKQFTYRERPQDYLLFLGRIHPEKGTLEAIGIAKRSNKKMILAGPVQDAGYFNKKIAPLVDNGQVVYAGNCNPTQRDELLGNALALLHPILFDEPFGLSVAEAMCCGTPVIAFNRGSMPELVAHGETGFIVNNIVEAADAVACIPSIGRKNCHDRAIRMFATEIMAGNYLDVYHSVSRVAR